MNSMGKRIVLLGIVLVVVLGVVASVASERGGLPAAQPGPTTAPAPVEQVVPAVTPQPDRAQQLQQRLGDNPRDSAAMSELAGMAYQAKRYAQAADLFYQAIDVEPNNSQLHLGLGVALFYQGMQTMAQHELKRAIEIDPNNVEAHFNYGLAISHGPRGDLKAAEAEWEAVARLDQGDLGRRARELLGRPQPAAGQ